MKLHCPHCGVRGSAPDSYAGQKVKCPKCQGIFEVVPEIASEQQEEQLNPAALSAWMTESSPISGEVKSPAAADDVEETETEEPLSNLEEEAEEIDERTAEPEEEPLAAEQEEMLTWEDVASELELQSTDDEKEEERQEIQDGDPANLSSLDDQFEAPADDLEYLVEENNPAKVEPVEFDNHLQERREDSEGTVPNDEIYEEELTKEEAGWIQESVRETDTVHPEPELKQDEIDSDQCRQCGKKGSVGEPLISKNGRLYCPECLPIEDEDGTEDSGREQVTDDTLEATGLNAGATDFMENVDQESTTDFSAGSAIREAWSQTKGAKGTIWAASAIMYLVILIILGGTGLLLPSLIMDRSSMTGLAGNLLFQVVINCFNILFTAGLLLIGVRKVAEKSISWKMIFKGFSCAGKIIIAAILQFLLVTIGFLLLILPGIYLSMGYIMTIPLIVDKGLSPWQAMETSRKAVHKVWWKVAGIFTIMGLIFLVSFIPMAIGVIWTWPMFIILVGVVYRHLYGQDNKTA